MAKKEQVQEVWKPKYKFYPANIMHKEARFGTIEIRQGGYVAKSEEEEGKLFLAAKNPRIPIVLESDRPLPVTKEESDSELKKLRNESRDLADEKARLMAEMEQMKAEIEAMTAPK